MIFRQRLLSMELFGFDEDMLKVINKESEDRWEVNSYAVLVYRSCHLNRSWMTLMMSPPFNLRRNSNICLVNAFQEWMEAIEKFCGKVQNTVSGSVNERDVKQLRSLEVNVIEAHSSTKVSHPYCTISLNEVKTCITKTQESHSPIWNEEFKFK